MFKRSLLLCGLSLMLALSVSCFLDPDEEDPIVPPAPPIEEKDLTEKWHVLNNIEYAYSKRRWETYDALLSTEFTFFFDEGDVGGEIPAQWGRFDELNTTRRLFISNTQSDPPEDPVCNSIKLDLQYDPNNIPWSEVIPETAPDEIWYRAPINYNFQMKMDGDLTFIQPDATAEFTIRNAGTVDAPHWELVEFRDLGAN